MPLNYRYKTSFSSQIKCIVDEEKDKFLSLASLSELQNIIPKEILGDGNQDLLPIASNLAVINKVNLNDDAMTTDTVLAIYKSLIHKGINVEHMRDRMCGHVIATAFSKFSTDYNKGIGSELIDIKDLKDEEEPFNFSYAGVLYKLVNENLINAVLDSNDPLSPNYLSVSSSWEVGFTSYSIAKGSTNLIDAEIIKSDNEKIFNELNSILKVNGGEGQKDGEKLYRVIDGSPIFLGVGLTSNPAAKVKGLIIPDEETEEEETEESESKSFNINIDFKENKELKELIANEIDEFISKNPDKLVKPPETQLNETKKDEKNISLSKNIDVKKDSKIMKINTIKDITDENLKEASAAQVRDFLEEKLREGSEQWLNEKNKLANDAKELSEKHQTLVAEHDEVKKSLEDIKAELKKLEDEKIAREQEEQYTQRLAAIDDTYELTDEERKVIADEVKGLEDKDFEAYSNRLKVLMKHKDKEVIKAQKDKAKEKETEAKTNKEEKEEVTASVDDALDNADKKNKSLPNASEGNETLKDKYAKAFAAEGWVIKNKHKKALI